MDKLTMAHEFAKIILDSGLRGDWDLVNLENVAADAFILADAMQAEADKRKEAEAEQKRKEVREILDDANTFIEREGQHFDDVNECEVDWRLSPSWAKFWVIRNSGASLWCTIKPTLTEDCLLSNGPCGPAPSFGFTGNHIVERPQ